MDIIQELESLKSFIAGLARTDMEYCSLPPQHGFAQGTTVESVIKKIDDILNKWTNVPSEEQRKSVAARRLRYLIDHQDFDLDTTHQLLEITNIMENELNELRLKDSVTYSFSTDASVNCLALVQYIHGYVENGGPHTQAFINGLYSYLDKISSEIQELKEQPKDFLIAKLKDIVERN